MKPGAAVRRWALIFACGYFCGGATVSAGLLAGFFSALVLGLWAPVLLIWTDES